MWPGPLPLPFGSRLATCPIGGGCSIGTIRLLIRHSVFSGKLRSVIGPAFFAGWRTSSRGRKRHSRQECVDLPRFAARPTATLYRLKGAFCIVFPCNEYFWSLSAL